MGKNLLKSAYIALMLIFISSLVLALKIRLVNIGSFDWTPVSELNMTAMFQQFNITLIPVQELNVTPTVPADDLLRVRFPEPTYPYGILTRSLMELVVNAMVCGWIVFVTACLALYLANRRFAWSRKKTISVILLTVIGGVFFNFASWLYQVRPYVLDAEFVYFGYPFVWLSASRSTFWGSPNWAYEIQWYGAIGNIAIYMWIISGVLVGFMIFPKMLTKLIHNGCRL